MPYVFQTLFFFGFHHFLAVGQSPGENSLLRFVMATFVMHAPLTLFLLVRCAPATCFTLGCHEHLGLSCGSSACANASMMCIASTVSGVKTNMVGTLLMLAPCGALNEVLHTLFSLFSSVTCSSISFFSVLSPKYCGLPTSAVFFTIPGLSLSPHVGTMRLSWMSGKPISTNNITSVSRLEHSVPFVNWD